MNTTIKTVDDYITLQKPEVQILLNQIRQAIKNAAPDAQELISYSMPAYKQDGILVYFAVFKNHIGFYPTASGIANFKNELTIYKGAKGSVQFPINQEMPLDLIADIVKFKVKENLEKTKSKTKK